MKLRLFVSLLGLALVSSLGLRAQPEGSDYLAALVANDTIEEVLKKIRTKLEAGSRTAEALAPEFAELDRHAADFSDNKELAARFAYTKAALLIEALNDLAGARPLLQAVKRDYSDTDYAGMAEQVLARLDRAAKRDAANAELMPLMKQIETKARDGAHTVEALAPEIEKLDALVAKYASNPEAAASIAYIKALVHIQMINDTAKGRELLIALAEKYPGTLATEAAQAALTQLDHAAQEHPATSSSAEK